MTTRKPRILILGGGYAGLHLARRLAHPAMPAADITLIDANDSWRERIRLHQLAAGQALPAFAYPSMLASLGVAFVQGRVEAIEAEEKRVWIQAPQGGTRWLEYDYLALALGSRIRRPAALDGLLALDHPGHAQTIHEQLAARPRARVLIAGGGLSGLETAFELADAWPQAAITLADAGQLTPSRLPGGFHRKAADYLAHAAAQRGIRWLSGAEVIAAEAGHATLKGGVTLDFDVGALAAGFAASPLIAAAGLACDARGQALTAPDLSLPQWPEIVALGDNAAMATPDGGPCRMSCATALPAAIGAANTLRARMTGQAAAAFHFQYVFRCVSLGRGDGLIQFVDSRDAPTRQIWTGAKAAAWKEFICRRTLATLGLIDAPQPPHLPPLAILPRLQRMQRAFA
ncbi:NAD(P)/FAD-dependent oxidoreductase [Chromobacterium sp. IIBBL 290-4]|uniref:NAD(P)/FAD-dependent oxidoreductase n=1 Tax=Chromobacterium sp. IIBBL 290-4 TaxID=2953890 RepID=UPI0020B818C4|nr:FAD-dependent oxidoreductase [Chromobacterium sp. IIBBL 290-4]UTH75375.1 FAD-dependent oxidoreductase [Chromobacterium sp. IIBBL 290-4]